MTASASHVSQFTAIALQSKRISFALRLDVPEGYVVMKLISHGPGDEANLEAGYSFYFGATYAGKRPALSKKPGRSTTSICSTRDSESYMWRDNSIDNSLKWIIKDWPQGKPDFDSIKIESKASPIKGAALKQLLLAVCLEVFGQAVPEKKELVAQAKKTRQKNSDLRTQCLEWLQSGPLGVQQWNELRVDQRSQVGKLGKCQFGGCKLSGARFGNQDLRGSDFRQATLREAHFGGADCRGVDFRGANLNGAWLAGGKFLQADFSDADCRNVAINAADCRGAMFSGTDLSGADFSFSDLRHVDLSRAKLDRANLFRIKYDKQTKFPADFVIDPELRMECKGAIQRKEKYKAGSPLEELLKLIPPPKKPRDAIGDWDQAETLLGVRLPADFKQLIGAYGSGQMLGGLKIHNPLTEAGRKRIAEDLESLDQLRESCEYLWKVYPEKGGVLPWGFDSHGNFFCWITRGKPDKWPTGQLGRSAEEPETDNVNITTFLANYARNQYPEMQGGQTFQDSDYKFTAK